MLGKALDLDGTERATSFTDVRCRHLKLQDTYNPLVDRELLMGIQMGLSAF